jgi:hypothetical protein
MALLDRLTDEIVKPPGTPTPIIAKKAMAITETQTPKLTPEETKIKLLMLPQRSTPMTTPRPTPRPKAKAKAKATTVKNKAVMTKQDDKMSKKSTQQPPSKISTQVIRELFEDAKNKKAITAIVYLEFADVWNHFYANKGNKEIKAVDSKKLKELYAEYIYTK